MTEEYVDYISGVLHLVCKNKIIDIPPSSILQINFCRPEEIFHGDEEFHILIEKNQFWLIGPFVNGAPTAIFMLSKEHPEIPSRNVLVGTIPWKFREAGILGLRLFPIAGFGVFPIKELSFIKIIGE